MTGNSGTQGLPKMSRDEWTTLIGDVKAGYRIDQAFSESTGTTLPGSGNNRIASCPFHQDKNPSMSVDLNQGVYNCHSAGCGAGGDVLTLLQAVYHISFREAVVMAARRIGAYIPADLMSIRTASKEPHKRKFIRYPEDKPGSVPSDLTDPTYVTLPDHIGAPQAGQVVMAWDPAKAGGLRARRFVPQMVHSYRTIEGRIQCVILRCLTGEKPDQAARKFFIPLYLDHPAPEAPASHSFDAGDGQRLSWIVGNGPENARRPLYGMEAFSAWNELPVRNLLFVDGEKTVDATRKIFEDKPEWLILSGMGGSNAVLRADWSPFMKALSRHAPVNVFVLPDADDLLVRPDGTKVDRQEKYASAVMTAIFQAACDHAIPRDTFTASRVTPPFGKNGGWDLADAFEEGWDAQAAQEFLDQPRSPVSPSTLALRAPKALAAVKKTDDATARTTGSGANQKDVTMIEDLDGFVEETAAANLKAKGEASPATVDGLNAVPVVEAPPGTSEPATSLVDEIEKDGGRRPTFNEAVYDNPYFRCLGHRDGQDYIINLEACHIYCLNAATYKPTNLLRLARKDWWMTYFPGIKPGTVNWEGAYDALISACCTEGIWEASREVGQGACIDDGRIVFNTGSVLYVEGLGVVPIREFRGDKCYTLGGTARMPAFDNPFGPNEPAILSFLDIIKSLDWQEERRDLSIMALFGWIAIGPIAGILSWRPHLWLDGPRSSGKSWINDNLIAPALGSYCLKVKANSTESGIRNGLNGKAFPLIFDEAEGETKADRERVDMIIRLARHSASDGTSVVLQGTSGGGGQRHFSIRSPFLFSSITPQLEAAADKTRFAHAHLGEGRGLEDFIRNIEGPARDLLTPQFSDRMIARIVMRAKDYHETQARMTEGLTRFGLERRIVDVYGTFATGAWLMLEDGVPESGVEAITFIQKHFKIVLQIKDFGMEVSNAKDHNRLFAALQSAVLHVDCRATGPRRESIGNLIASASGFDAGDSPLTQAEAIQALRNIGIRPVHEVESEPGVMDWKFVRDGEQASAVVIHRNAAPLTAILEKSGYARSYSEVMLQARNVLPFAKVVRFSPTIGSFRAVIVPLENFSIGEADEQQ